MAEVVGSAAVVSRLTLLLMFCINSDKLILSAMIVQTVCSVIFKRPNFYQTIITTTEFVPVTLYFRQYAYVQQRILPLLAVLTSYRASVCVFMLAENMQNKDMHTKIYAQELPLRWQTTNSEKAD